MYLYFDKQGILKEIVNDYIPRVGNSNVNKLFIYIEDFIPDASETEPLNWATIRYQKNNGEYIPPTTSAELEMDVDLNVIIPHNDRRDLKYFKYYKNYPCFVATVPDDVLDLSGVVISSVRVFNTEEEIYTLGDICFNVERTGTALGNIEWDGYVSIAQYNALMKKINDFGVGEYVPYIGALSDVNLGNHDLLLKGSKAALDNEVVKKVTSTEILYGTDDEGHEDTLSYAITTNPYSIVQRDSGGQVVVPQQPVSNGSAASKKYVDDNIKNVREVAAGKCKSFVVDTTLTTQSIKAEIEDLQEPKRVYLYYNDTDVTADFDNDQYNVINGDLDTTNDTVSIGGNNKWIAVERDTMSYYLVENSDFKNGDEVYVIKQNVPDRWFDFYAGLRALETKTDLTNYPTLNGNNTFTGKNSFTHVAISGKINPNTNDYGLVFPSTTDFTADSELVDTNTAQTITGVKTIATQTNFKFGTTAYIQENNAGNLIIFGKNGITISNNYGTNLGVAYGIQPISNASEDIGTSSLKWRDVYLSRNLKDGTNSLSIADIVKSTFNVIDATDIVSNTLTQAQYDLITNGKPTLIKGSLLGKTNIILLDGGTDGNNYYFISCYYNSGSTCEFRGISVSSSTKVISLAGDSSSRIRLNSLYEINGKSIPAYPASTGSFTLKCVDGVLTWVAD